LLEKERKLNRPEKKKTLAIPLSRQWAIKSAAAVHVLARLALGDGSDAADVSTGNRFPLGGVKSGGNPKHLHYLQLILAPLSFSFSSVSVLLLLLLLHDAVHEVRHRFLRLLVILLRRVSPVALPRRVGGRRPVMPPAVGALAGRGRARVAGAATVRRTRARSLAACSVSVSVTIVLISSSFSFSVASSVTVSVAVTIGHGGRCDGGEGDRGSSHGSKPYKPLHATTCKVITLFLKDDKKIKFKICYTFVNSKINFKIFIRINFLLYHNLSNQFHYSP